ncbi:MAG: hypothetical protein CBB71_01470 [Rhodopirellula sp. TMED11]|nr:MAG: hypothetical protein CBB71_01470 [Rhodopirellula sp. TMED11]
MSNLNTQRYGSLDCHVIDHEPATKAANSPQVLFVLCHGFGAPGSDLVDVGRALGQFAASQGIAMRVLCPEAPISLDDMGLPGGRAWWRLNMAALMETIQAEQFEELHQSEPPGLDEARQMLGEVIQLALQELNDDTVFVLGGFSQGAMLTMDTALRGDWPAPQLLLQYSGTVICESHWRANMQRLGQSVVYQSHGRWDPILPFVSAQRLHELMEAAGVQASFHAFEGQHSIDQQCLVDSAQALLQLLGDQSK